MYFEDAISWYVSEGWDIFYLDGASEVHVFAGMVGEYSVYFGDRRDVAEVIPINDLQTNYQGKLRTALCTL